MKRYRSVKLNSDISMNDEIMFEEDEENDSIILPQAEEMMEAEEVLELDDGSEEI